MKPIVQNGDPVLRQTARPVPEELFGSEELKGMLKDMEEALDAQKNGVALAAPQIGLSYRIFIVRFDRMQEIKTEGEEPPADVGVFINPVIIKSSRKRVEVPEGCLSVDRMYGTTLRHERATVRAQTEDGSVFERGGGGIVAQAYQHEIDHLDGILFIDHAEDLHEFRKDNDA